MFLVLFTTSKLLAQLPDLVPLDQPVDIMMDHFEVHIDYVLDGLNENTLDDGWQFSVSFDADNNFTDATGISRLAPSTVRLIAAPGTQQTIQNSSLARFGDVGDTIWILPQNNVPGVLYLGIRTVVKPFIFQASVTNFSCLEKASLDDPSADELECINFSPDELGSIVLQMVSVSGTGPDNGGSFAMWEARSLGGLEFHFDSSDGISRFDRLDTFQAGGGGHTHYNWGGMTRPGTYEVTFRASGKINPGYGNRSNKITSGEATFTFIVPFLGYVSGSADLRLSDSVELPASIYDADDSCEYATNQVALIAENGGASVPYGLSLNLVSDAESAPSRVGIDGDAPVALPASFQLQGSPLELLQAEGPGDVAMETNGTQVSFSFDEAGIYRLKMSTRLLDESNAILGQPFTITVLVGLPVDYTYSDYADSFERQHGLNPGTLSDPFADFDGDTVPNGIEYQLFWHGFDPVVFDYHHMPLPTFENGSYGLTFLRDTYKDDFLDDKDRIEDDFLPNIEHSFAASHSSDLQTWASWHTKGASKPTRFPYEDGTNAESIGRIMKRRLLLEEASDAMFFRFKLFLSF